jgi:hypothetical protein
MGDTQRSANFPHDGACTAVPLLASGRHTRVGKAKPLLGGPTDPCCLDESLIDPHLILEV